MIIPSEELFNNETFVVNKDMKVETIETSVAKITIIDDFYEDIDSVIDQVDKLPVTKIWNHDPNNNKTYFDGRKVYCNNMKGSLLPYSVDGTLINIVSEIIGYPSNSIDIDPENTKLLVNCFKFTDELNLKDHYYGAHRDPYMRNSIGQVALVIFLNRNYEEGEGMNFYDGYIESDHTHLRKKDALPVVKRIQGKCNRAVLFDSKFTHGQHTPTDQFKKEMRYTQVIFLSLM